MASNLYRRGRTWWGRIQLAGRDRRRSLRTADRGEAGKRFKTWKERLTSVRYGTVDATFKEAAVRWEREYLSSAVKPATAQRYRVSLRQLDATFGPLHMSDIDRAKVAAYVSSRQGAATNATIRRDLSALSSILRCCVAWQWRESNPARDFDRAIIRERRDPINPPTPGEVETVRRAASPPAARIVAFSYATGVRQAEAVRLEWRDVRAAAVATLQRTKSSRARTIALASPGGDGAAVIAASPRHLKCQHVFWHGDGEPFRNLASNFAALVRRVVAAEAKAGRTFRKFRFHDLRHAFAVNWLRAGGDIYALKTHLGHASVKTTEVYLGHVGSKESIDTPAQKPAQ